MGNIDDCTFCSAIEWWRAIGNPQVPATHQEAEELRCDSGRGPLGGTNLDDVRKGIAKRYSGTTPPTTLGAAAIWSAMVPGTAGCVQGNMAAFPAGSPYRRWDPSFAGAHCVAAYRLDSTERVWWCDPLAPLQYREGTRPPQPYDGVWMAKADFLRYINALPGARALVAPIVPDKEKDMNVTAQVSERWHPTVTGTTSNGVLRGVPDRAAPVLERIPAGGSIVTIAEVLGNDGGNWRLVKTADRAVRYALRTDWISDGFVVDADATAAYNAGVVAASTAALTAKK